MQFFCFTLEDPPDGIIIEALNFGDTDFFPNIRQLLILGGASPIGSNEVERAALGVTRLKTPYRSTIGDKRESDFNLLHLQRISSIDIQSITRTFIRKYPQKMFKKPVQLED